MSVRGGGMKGVCSVLGGAFSKQFSYTVSIHLKPHDVSPGLSELSGQFPGTPSRLQSCKPTLHLRGKKRREGRRGEREEEERGKEMVGGKEGRRGDTAHTIIKFNSNLSQQKCLL